MSISRWFWWNYWKCWQSIPFSSASRWPSDRVLPNDKVIEKIDKKYHFYCLYISSTGKLKLIRWQSCHEVNIVFLINFQRSFSSNPIRSGKYIVCGEAMTKEGEIMQVEKKNIKKIKGCQKKSSSTFCIHIIMTILDLNLSQIAQASCFETQISRRDDNSK